ncbi:MAG: site-specific recombinase [Chloroflexota bacterium]|jgi:DNA invertase Pin-like site-specific DNA recombinase|nr:site-specific recombinase [Chloroflexota bacterium]
MIAAAYLRRSSVTGERPGDASREAQEAAVRRLCGDDVVLYVDWGITGSGKKRRPEYDRLKADIAAGKIESVCAYSLSRLGRSTKELLDFVELCKAHGTTVATAVEHLDTAGAMGELLLTIMAAVAQFESQIGAERSAASREAETVRYAAAGMRVAPKFGVYGKRVVKGADGLRVLVDDPDRPIEPIIEAWRGARTFRGTVEALGRLGIPSPFGAKRVKEGGTGGWSTAALARVLTWYADPANGDSRLTDDERALLLTTATTRGGRRSVPREPTVLQGLLHCHCGRRMTPNRHHRSYYCSRGHLDGTSRHGRFTIGERALLDVLRPIAERYSPQRILGAARTPGQAERTRIERAMANLDAKLDAGRIDAATYKTSIAALNSQLARLTAQDRNVDLLHRIITSRSEAVPSWDDAPAMNAHLHRIWTAVRLDEDMQPTVEWAVPEWTYNAELEAAMEAENVRQDRERAG